MSAFDPWFTVERLLCLADARRAPSTIARGSVKHELRGGCS
ncbi:MAG: hypothetical protein U9R47_01070 [Actinomycetota bacterium]|nr:hypothetical protein [Actinomycetota bacterium]